MKEAWEPCCFAPDHGGRKAEAGKRPHSLADMVNDW